MTAVALFWPFQRVLDVGCNSGPIRRRMRERFGADFEYVGIDFNETALSLARAHAATDARATFIVADLRKPLPFADGEFDIAVSTSVLQCLSPTDLVVALGELRRVAKCLVVIEDYGDGEESSTRGWAHNYPPWVIRVEP